MSTSTSVSPTRVSVLIVAADAGIESLLGQMVAFAGYRPVYDVTVGAAGESIRRVRPEVAIVDTSVAAAVAGACIAAASEVGAVAVLTSATASDVELTEEAQSRHCSYFALTAGRKRIAAVIQRALAERRLTCGFDFPGANGAVLPSVRASICAAIAAVGRARLVALRAERILRETQALRSDVADSSGETTRSHAALRDAVTNYARGLRADDISVDRAIIRVRETLLDCANVVGATLATEALLGETESWARAAYAA